jgi:hypothetical protein
MERGSDTMLSIRRALVLYDGLISGYTVAEAAFVGARTLTDVGFPLIIQQMPAFSGEKRRAIL